MTILSEDQKIRQEGMLPNRHGGLKFGGLGLLLMLGTSTGGLASSNVV